jgi:hypothetical protein
MQAKSQAQAWSKLSRQLSTVSSDLTACLEREVVPNTWGAIQKGFDTMVEVYQTKIRKKDAASVSGNATALNE